MIDVKIDIRKAYKIALENIGVPYFYGAAPDTNNAPIYVVINMPSNDDVSTKYKHDVNVDVVVTVHASAQKSNNGLTLESVVNAIYAAIYPNQNYLLQLDNNNLNLYGTIVVSDTEDSWNLASQLLFQERTITFRHSIFITQ